MAVEPQNVRILMGWLAQDSHVRSEVAAAGMLGEKLAQVVFQGDAQWADRPDQIDGYCDTLNAWLATDSGNEQQFIALTVPEADPAAFVDWFLQVVTEWESRAAGQQTGAQQTTGDPSAAEPGRYSEPARADNYGLTCRYDSQAGVYEWYDEAGQTWRDQAWADQHAADATGGAGAAGPGAQAPAADASAESAPEWDENWKMFYRVDSGGAYQFADAVTPGERASGCSGTWLSHDQVARTTTEQAAEQATEHATEQVTGQATGQQQSLATDPHAAAADAMHKAMLAAVGSAFESDPALKGVLTDEHIKAVLADVAKEVIG
jgi:hypothetical protein